MCKINQNNFLTFRSYLSYFISLRKIIYRYSIIIKKFHAIENSIHKESPNIVKRRAMIHIINNNF